MDQVDDNHKILEVFAHKVFSKLPVFLCYVRLLTFRTAVRSTVRDSIEQDVPYCQIQKGKALRLTWG
jgi:hypothetical protein